MSEHLRIQLIPRVHAPPTRAGGWANPSISLCGYPLELTRFEHVTTPYYGGAHDIEPTPWEMFTSDRPHPLADLIHPTS